MYLTKALTLIGEAKQGMALLDQQIAIKQLLLYEMEAMVKAQIK
jgi:hypothetical protein